MRRTLVHRPSASMVVAAVALVLALAGTAFAGPIAKLVTGDKLIKKGSLSGNRLRNHTLTGAQLNLGRLGTVPAANKANSAGFAATAGFAANAGQAANANQAASANQAANATNAGHAASADTVGGVSVAHARFIADASTPETPLFSTGGLTLSAACNASGQPVIKWSSDAGGSVMWRYNVDGPTTATGEVDLTPPIAQTFSLTTDGKYRMTMLYVTGGGTSVEGQFLIVKNGFGGTKACVLTGDAFKG